MSDGWSPELRLQAHAGRCRLSLDGVTWGEGVTLQDAANDLLARLFDLVMGLRRTGYRLVVRAGRPDPRVAGFLWEAGELMARGGDLRQWVFARTGGSPAA